MLHTRRWLPKIKIKMLPTLLRPHPLPKIKIKMPLILLCTHLLSKTTMEMTLVTRACPTTMRMKMKNMPTPVYKNIYNKDHRTTLLLAMHQEHLLYGICDTKNQLLHRQMLMPMLLIPCPIPI